MTNYKFLRIFKHKTNEGLMTIIIFLVLLSIQEHWRKTKKQISLS
mgnify:FL=1